MKKKLLNISGMIKAYVKPLALIQEIAEEQQISFFIVGATARDIIMQFGYGINTGRATFDLDIAIQVPDWNSFQRLQNALLHTGKFSPDKAKQRLWFVENKLPVDIIPFGRITESKRSINWPPDYGTELDIVGFDEAWVDAVDVLIDDKMNMIVKCASISGLTVMKLVAWDSRNEQNNKDAADLVLFLKYYAEAGNVDRLYENETLLLEEDFDLEIAAVSLLGRDIGRMLLPDSRKHILDILAKETEEGGRNKLAEDLARYLHRQEEQSSKMMFKLKKLKQGIEEVRSGD